MMKHLRITVDGKAYDVIVEDLTEDTGGTLYPAPGTMAAAQAAARPTTVAPAPVAPAAPAAGGDGDKLAPLGGVVVEICVKVGDTVNAGDKVATIEAMKMKTAVSAHRGGTVTAIPVNVGDAVDAGQCIVTIA